MYENDIEKALGVEFDEYKHDKDKNRLDLVPPSLMLSVGEIMTYGANKYGEDNWRCVAPHRYRGALLRHLMAYLKDTTSVDEESGYLHLWHVACNVAFLLEIGVGDKSFETGGVTFEEGGSGIEGV